MRRPSPPHQQRGHEVAGVQHADRLRACPALMPRRARRAPARRVARADRSTCSAKWLATSAAADAASRMAAICVIRGSAQDLDAAAAAVPLVQQMGLDPTADVIQHVLTAPVGPTQASGSPACHRSRWMSETAVRYQTCRSAPGRTVRDYDIALAYLPAIECIAVADTMMPGLRDSSSGLPICRHSSGIVLVCAAASRRHASASAPRLPAQALVAINE